MAKLIENVLIGDRVRLVGEDISEADAKGVRPEVFATSEAPATSETDDVQGATSDDAEDEQIDASESEEGDDGQQGEESAKPSSGRGKRTSTK
jgi:hypothetical protein